MAPWYPLGHVGLLKHRAKTLARRRSWLSHTLTLIGPLACDSGAVSVYNF